MNTENTMPAYCTQCPNHCPANDLHCGRGRAYFAHLTGTAPEQPDDHEMHEFREGRGPLEGRRPHEGRGPREGRGPHEDRGPHGHHAPFPPRPEITEDAPLEVLLRACGHRLHAGQPGGPHGSQEQVLKILQLAGGSVDQRDLQEAMHIRPASISELLRKLEEKELIERTRDEEDRRKAQISLSKKGKAFVSVAREPRREDADLFEVLTEEEQENLRILLLKLLKNWQK